MTLRHTEKHFSTSAEANKIPVLPTYGELGALDGSQLLNLNFTAVPPNSKSMTYSTSQPSIGTDTIDIMPNRVYHTKGLSSSVGGTFRLTQAFVDAAEEGDRVVFIFADQTTATFVNVAGWDSATSLMTHTWNLNSKSITTGTATAFGKGSVLTFITHFHPETGRLMLLEEKAFGTWDSLADVDFGGTAPSTAAAIRYNPIAQKWTDSEKAFAFKEVVITNANINSLVSYDRFFDSASSTRETDGPYFRLSQNPAMFETDGSYDHLHIIWQATSLTVQGVPTAITEAKIVLPNINNFWIMKTITILLDSTEITLRVMLEKDAALVDTTQYIENANYSTTPQVDAIENFKLNCNVPYGYRTGIRFLGVGASDFVASMPDDAGTLRKSWLMI